MFKRPVRSLLLAFFMLPIFVRSVFATDIMPNFSGLPTGWTTDRYEPALFANVGPFAGRTHVLGIGIDGSTSLPNRPPAFQFTFYNTQGRQYAFSPYAGPGSVLSADLYVPTSWSNEANGTVRTDMWGVLRDAGNAISAYPIIGFTNYGGTPRLRVWEGSAWVDLTAPIIYDSWNQLSMELMPDTSVRYFANGALVYTDTNTSSSVAISATIMQAYNFGDPSLVPAPVVNDYLARWANSLGPSSAGVEISGRVLTGDGRFIRNAVVTLTRPDGTSRSTVSSSFGFYRFEDVQIGESVVISARSRLFRFKPRIVQVVDAMTDLDLIGVE